ncbi:MAG: YihY/virulence factor BrkB family protein [Thermodesulfobacteriota bacterium]|nr:YihY/virulence factor BrkB family protein [Thermodesulfobacteriota bacterium]
MESISSLISRTTLFVKTDIWRIPLKNISWIKAFFIRQLRILLLFYRGLKQDSCQLRASALTLYSLLSVVPIVSIVFGIAKGFGFETLLHRELLEAFPGQKDVIDHIIVFAHSLLENTKGGLLAGIGVLVLFWSGLKILDHIEYSFNDIWGIKYRRPFGKKISNYLSFMLIFPLLFIMSGSINLFILTQISLITERVSLLDTVTPIIFFLLKLLPYFFVCAFFTFLYIFMPNINVRFSSALIGGILAGTLFEILQWGYINLQIWAARYNAIYGSFAALPLLLLWLQTSWLIILFGAEISYAHQNVDNYEFEPDSSKISHSLRKLLSLYAVHLIINKFTCGAPPLTLKMIANTLGVPVRMIQSILYDLVESGILNEVRIKKDQEIAYQPAYDVNRLSIHDVLEALEQRGDDEIHLIQTEGLKTLSQSLDSFKETIQNSPANILLKDVEH